MAVHDTAYADTLQKVRVETPEGVVEVVGGSFAGIPFFVESVGLSGGRNVVTRALPFSGSHVNEDTGKKVREFPVDFYLLGENVEAKRAELEAALNREGAFELVHPYFGKFFARATAYSFNYGKTELEYVSGSATFVPEGDEKNPGAAKTDLRGVAVEKAAAVAAAAKAKFVGSFDLAGKAKAVVDSVAGFTSGLIDDVETARSAVRSVSEFANTVSGIRSNMEILLMSPEDFATRIRNLLFMVSETAKPSDYNRYVNESLVGMGNFRTADETGISNPKAAELAGKVSLLSAMTSAAMAVECVVNSEFRSVEEAEAMQGEVSAAFANMLLRVEDSDDYADILDMEAAALKFLRDSMSKLSVVVEMPLSGIRDVLSVCFDCYGDLSRLDDVVERNGLLDAMFVTRDKLRVLSE